MNTLSNVQRVANYFTSNGLTTLDLMKEHLANNITIELSKEEVAEIAYIIDSCWNGYFDCENNTQTYTIKQTYEELLCYHDHMKEISAREKEKYEEMVISEMLEDLDTNFMPF